ncbi:MAG: M28 family peptidase [Anaerolineales bacterium]|nr:M28 family peptidase [Anaerolineales bacterium]
MHLSEKAEKYLQRLCLEIPNRCVGSKGNRAATEIFAEGVASFGFKTECPEFDCVDWTHNGARLTVNHEPFDIFVSPYSLGCHLSAPLAVVSTVEELETVEAANKIILARGNIAKEQLMPKNFPFYNPDEHKRIIHLLETKAPQAIIASTSRNPELAGGLNPFPLIEDGDFDIPSVYMTEEEGNKLIKHAGKGISLDILSKRSPAKGYNVIARKVADSGRKVVLCAHIDTHNSKDSTPGALDNASGVVVLLLLAELLENYNGRLGIEIVALNGEEYYSSLGEVQYLKSNQGRFNEIFLNINLDLVGYYQGNTAYSLYDCPDDIVKSIRKAFSTQKDIVEGEPWYQGDHMIFTQKQVPALAITSSQFMELLTNIAHTAQDRPELVDCSKLTHVAKALHGLLLDLDKFLS